ncbi:MAG: HupE/UreJ family protein, partial [Pseudomonadota bacterium]
MGVPAHPEDELCVPGESSLDPALCEQLAALDRADNSTLTVSALTSETGQALSAASTFAVYVNVGIDHILPGGLDHILFVLALFLSSTHWRSLVIQITMFTLAHTVTLALAATGVIAPSPGIVEPLIAASIAFVAIENIFVREIPRWRPAVVFLFGLLHGMGFSGFFGELRLPADQFWSGLVGFNVGVELGQFAVVAVAFALALVWRRLSDKQTA